MLFKQKQLLAIKDGRVKLAFRKWKKSLVKNGSEIKTSIGLVKIQDISQVEQQSITEKDAVNAGYSQLSELTEILESKKNGEIFKIRVKYHGADPRIELRNNADLSSEQFNQIKAKLDKFDRYSKNGNWTYKVLFLIMEHEGMKAQYLADKLGYDKMWLKVNIRKLKNLGLTISLGMGYKISPRGMAFMDRHSKDVT